MWGVRGLFHLTLPGNNSPSLMEARTGTQGREKVMERPWMKLHAGLLSVAHSARFLKHPGTTSPGVSLPAVCWTPPHTPIINQENSPQTCPQMETSPQLRFLLPDN